VAAKPCAQLRSVEGIQYELVRKKVKQLHLRVRDNGTVMVSIPLTASLEQADRFVLQNAQWIRDTRVKNITKRNKDNADLPDKATALAYFTAMSDKVYPAFAGVLGGQKPVLKVRSMTSRWGVCCARVLPLFAVEPQPGLLGRGGKAAAGLEGPAGTAEKIIYRKNGGKFPWKTKKRPAINIPNWPAIL